MSGISPNHPNKFETCYGCPDRTIEPINCHSTCRGYLFRIHMNQKKYEEKKIRSIVSSDIYNIRRESYVLRMRYKLK